MINRKQKQRNARKGRGVVTEFRNADRVVKQKSEEERIGEMEIEIEDEGGKG